MGGGSIQTVVGVVKLNFEMHLASAVVKQVVTTEEYDSIRASYKENKKRVLYSGATQLFFSVMLFTVGMINIVDGTDELLLFFAAPFQAVGGMLALLAAHMGNHRWTVGKFRFQNIKNNLIRCPSRIYG